MVVEILCAESAAPQVSSIMLQQTCTGSTHTPIGFLNPHLRSADTSRSFQVRCLLSMHESYKPTELTDDFFKLTCAVRTPAARSR